MSVRLVVADPHPVVRAGLVAFFADADAQIVDEAQTGEQLVAKTLAAWPDVVLLDVKFPDQTGFEAVETLRARRYDGRIVFFSDVDQQASFARALAVGADSYLLKKTSRAELCRVVRALVADSDAGLERSGELRRVASLVRRRTVDPTNPLTPRETQVLRCIALGLSNKEIAASLRLSLDTIKEHVQNILRKLDARDRAQAAVWAVRNKLIP
ncbi:MAG: response regulator transcription factor [Thermoguttaceae bacterium]|nr:response regulator transcription factor [Thermoguttaceae bacterium]